MELIQDMNASSSSGTKKDERRERTVSKLAELEVIWSDRKRREQYQKLRVQKKINLHTAIDPQHRNGHGHKDIIPFQQKRIPKPQLGLKRYRIRKQSDVPLGRIRRRRNHMPLERRIHRGHHGLHETLLDVDGFKHAWKARVEDGVEVVGVVEEDEGGVDAFGLEVAEEGGSDGSHALYVATWRASEGKGVKDVKERSLAEDFSVRIIEDGCVFYTYPAPYRVLNMICPLIVLGTSKSIWTS